MLSKIANKITEFFINKKIIEEDEKDTYEYCFEVFLATALNLVIVITIGFIFKQFISTLIFCVFFMLLRGCTGGYHAKTHIACLFSIIIIFVLMLISISFIPVSVLYFISIVFFIYSIIIILLFSPVENKSNPLIESKINHLKKKLLILILLL